MPVPTKSNTHQIIERHDRFMSINTPRYPISMKRGKGVMLWDSDGKSYLDLFSGFGGPILGHCHDELVQTIQEQSQQLWHVGNLFHTEPQTRLAQTIARTGFGGQSFFCHSGADANEAALKLSRLYGKAHPGRSGLRFKVISAVASFHGRSFGAMAATGQKRVYDAFEPLPPGFVHVPFNEVESISQAIDDQTVAVLLEPIQGEGGVYLPHDGYLKEVRRLCDQNDLLLILDEVWTGCGRTGRMFAHQHWNTEPDIMTLAKGIGGGLAVGVMCARPSVAQYFHWQSHHGTIHATTLGGNCLSMAVAAKVLEVIDQDGLAGRAATMGKRALKRLNRFAQTHDAVKEVRGKGLFIGIELNQFEGSRTAKNIVDQCLEEGVLINAATGSVLRLAPALVITDQQLNDGLDVLEQVLNS